MLCQRGCAFGSAARKRCGKNQDALDVDGSPVQPATEDQTQQQALAFSTPATPQMRLVLAPDPGESVTDDHAAPRPPLVKLVHHPSVEA